MRHTDSLAQVSVGAPAPTLLLQEARTPWERFTDRLDPVDGPGVRAVAAALILAAMLVFGWHVRRDLRARPWREAVRDGDGSLRLDDGALVVVRSSDPAVNTARVLCVVTTPPEAGVPFRGGAPLRATHAWIGSLDALATTFARRERWCAAAVVLLATSATALAVASMVASRR